ncbi:hypothetical protein EDD18DRAFT_1344606 [Armillaria luteobubalina]|uniref:Uncharacterized protein n=1 Tax=Armillaria luteobubalina TaxID=153913 RepID=A0AA39QIU7_9AGAR|nr:hypothetical protein EDD18DRAFT_1344606 [Armillaria luteobubalina]
MGIHHASGSSLKIRLPVNTHGARTKPVVHSRKAAERWAHAAKVAEHGFLKSLNPEELAEVERQKICLAPTISLESEDQNDSDSSDWQDISDIGHLNGILHGEEVMEISHEGGEYELARDLHQWLANKWRKEKGCVRFKEPF